MISAMKAHDVTDRGRWVGRIALAVATSVGMLTVILALAVGARADAAHPFGITDFDVSFHNADGSVDTQAGSHPFSMTTSFHLNADGLPELNVDELKNATFQQVLGLVGDTTAVPRCSSRDFVTTPAGAETSVTNCGNDTAVGYVGLAIFQPDNFNVVSVYNLQPPPGVPAMLGFDILGSRVTIGLGVNNEAPYNAVATITNASQSVKFFGSTLTLWGIPSDPAHDPYRGTCLEPASGNSLGLCPTSAVRRPFLTLPRACSGPLTSTITADSWVSPGRFVTRDAVTHDDAVPANPLGMTGCDKLGFDPSVTSTPSTSVAGSPSGLDFGLDVDDGGLINPVGLAQADIHKTVVSLPAGVTVNPAFADGLAACGEQDLARETVASGSGGGCPEASKVGSAVVQSPLLDEPVEGSLYVATQNANPFGSLLALYLVLKDPGLGILIKQPLRVDLDPQTGQLTTTVDDIPQLPFAHLGLHINGGDRGALITPAACGTVSTHAVLTSTTNIAVGRDASAAVDAQCDRSSQFTPAFAAGTTTSRAAAHTSFVMDFSRPEGQKALSSVDVSLPPGLLGSVGSVPVCPEDRAVAGTCDAASRIGAVQVSAGAGVHPLWVPQVGRAPTAAYLAGPYKGAPYSLSIVVPAQAGPFDLGTVVVRTALFVDPLDAHITARSDPFPTILQGIPLQVREVRVTLDRPDFILNPTNCAQKQITGSVGAVDGQAVAVSSAYAASDCSALDLKPKLAIALTGKGQTTDDKHPGVHAVVSQPAGQANLKKVVVSLPLSLALDPDNANGLCEFTDGSKVDPTCPKASIVGKAVARTPILDQPLTGPVYFVKNVRKDPKSGREIRTLPKLVIPLTGPNGVRLNLVGTSSVVDDRLVTTFDNIPDAPVSDFTLDIAGGKHGILVVSGTDICKATQVAEQQVDGQNSKTADSDVYLQTTACSLKILSKKVGKTSVAVKVGGLGAGKVTVSGKGIKKTTKTITKSTVATVTAMRTKGKPGKVTVSFDPTGPAKAHKTTK
jgi:hypothetical protein